MKNQRAFLDMIAASELTVALLKVSDNGYNVLGGATASKPLLFTSYADHPRVYNPVLKSTAAGRYQLLARYFDYYKVSLGLNDFGPASQDAIALQQIKERHAIDNIDAGKIEDAIAQCCNTWASFPGNDYGQHKNSVDQLLAFYADAGGSLAV